MTSPFPPDGPFYIVVCEDDSAGAPIAMETMLGHSTLKDALDRQARFGTRFGRTRIAECRILPDGPAPY